MLTLLLVMATVAIVSSLLPALRARALIRATTLRESWHWGAGAIVLWTTAWLANDLLSLTSAGESDQLWFASAVGMVTPFVAVLGARRPGSRVWSAFIVLPLAIVLFLPAVTAWTRELHPDPLRLEAPMLAGYCLVLLMGLVNYVGTRFILSALLVAAACLGVLLPLSWLQTRIPFSARTLHAWATLLLGMAAWIADWQSRRPPLTSVRPRLPIERVLADFRDLFGIVWARRIIDRMNDAARKEGWPVRLHLDGVRAADPSQPIVLSEQEAESIERSLRWLLRRFVDPSWIDERLASRKGERPDLDELSRGV